MSLCTPVAFVRSIFCPLRDSNVRCSLSLSLALHRQTVPIDRLCSTLPPSTDRHVEREERTEKRNGFDGSAGARSKAEVGDNRRGE